MSQVLKGCRSKSRMQPRASVLYPPPRYPIFFRRLTVHQLDYDGWPRSPRNPLASASPALGLKHVSLRLTGFLPLGDGDQLQAFPIQSSASSSLRSLLSTCYMLSTAVTQKRCNWLRPGSKTEACWDWWHVPTTPELQGGRRITSLRPSWTTCEAVSM